MSAVHVMRAGFAGFGDSEDFEDVAGFANNQDNGLKCDSKEKQ
jgi:hypothetical protein